MYLLIRLSRNSFASVRSLTGFSDIILALCKCQANRTWPQPWPQQAGNYQVICSTSLIFGAVQFSP